MPPPNEDLPEKSNISATGDTTGELFRLLAENARDQAIFTIDPQGTITTWNPGVESLLGYTEQEWIGQSVTILFPTEELAKNGFAEELARAKNDRRLETVRWCLRKDGSPFWAEGSLVALYDAAGKLHGFGNILRDATSRKVAEDRIVESEQRFRAIFDQATVGICHTNLQGQYVLANDRYCEIVGRTRKELLSGLRLQDITHPDDLPQTLVLLDRLIRSGEAFLSVKRQLKPNGETIWVSNNVSLIHDTGGNPRYFQVLSQDITARKKIEEELRHAEMELAHQTRNYSVLVESAADSLARYSRDLRFIFVNPAFEQMSGFSRDQVIGKTYQEAGFSEESVALWEPTLRQVFETGKSLKREIIHTRPSDGQTRILERVIAPEFDPLGSGEVTTVLTFSRDITERKQQERRERFLAELTERLRSIADPGDVLNETATALGEFTKVNRCLYGEIDEEASLLKIQRDYVQGEGIQSMIGTYVLDSFGPLIVESSRRGEVTLSEDTESDPRLDAEHRHTFQRLNFRSFLCVPLHKEGRWVAILVLHSAVPRVWTEEETELLKKVAEQTWLAVENARLYRAMQEEIEERRSAERRVTEAYALERERAEREALLSNASRVLSSSLDYQETLTTIASLLIPRFADWCAVDLEDETGTVRRVAVEHVDPEKIAWGWKLSRQYPERMDAPRGLGLVLRTGKAEFIPNLVEESLKVVAQNDEHLALLREVGFVSLMIVPLVARGRVLGALTLVSTLDSGRRFRESDLALAEELGRRAALAIENARLFEETRQRAEREHLLNEISQAVRDADLSPDDIQMRATNLLGKALALDRCYFALYDPVRPVVRIVADWHREDLSSLTGEFPLPAIADTMPDVKAEMTALREQTTVYNDLSEMTYLPETRASLEGHGMVAMAGIVLKGIGGASVASLRAAMTVPRVWKEGEVTLIESVATLVRTSVESARLQQRERNIAQQLQDALQMPSPPKLPGILLEGFYKPALEEAGVGGDFWDVYPLDERRSVLCCGDLSGKGLAAASQVATIRNMVRLALYSQSDTESMAQAITRLNQILVQQDLLTGFATLFVGIYDSETRTLTYVNCGQEPGLLCRAGSHEIEELVPTGPVLAGFGAGDYTQRTIALSPGDIFGLFTDGLTEVGPNRRQLLEVEGIKRLFQECARNPEHQNNPVAIVPALIADVDCYAQGGARDDVALLIGVIQ